MIVLQSLRFCNFQSIIFNEIKIMRRISFVHISVFVCLMAALPASRLMAHEQRPNIVVFFVDDMGWVDTSVPFADSVTALNRRYHTPNMERLAKEGMKFTAAYATSVCTPSRVSLLTGINAVRHQVTNWTDVVKDRPTDQKDAELEAIDWNYNGLSPVPDVPHTVHATPLPQLLKDAGYFTVHVGKAHWGPQGTPGVNPLNMGFMVNVAGNAIGRPQSYYGKDNYGNIPGNFSYHAVQGLAEYYGTDTFLTEALTLEALKSIDAPVKAKQPFFLHLAHYAVHDPIQGDERFVQKYLDKGLDPVEAKYASLVEGMDKSLGDVMKYLEQNGVADNTVILFMSDNGGLSHYGRGGERHTQNLPLKAGKGSVYEGGIREPMIVKWPGVVRQASVCGQPVMIEDFFPSILEIAGVDANDLIQVVDGKSFVSLLKGGHYAQSDRLLVWHNPHRWSNEEGPGINFFSAIRQGKWKLIYNYKSEKLELYNLEKDLGEQRDLAAKERTITRRLAKKLANYLRSYEAQMPVYRATGKAVPWPDELTKIAR